ncbi:MAG: transglutaminase-like domain-containing protein [Spirochaeta sp.]
MLIYTEETRLLNYSHGDIAALFAEKGWDALDVEDRIREIYTFVRDEIAFGYNRGDAIPASEVLSDGYGQCNTKGILLMALLRRAGIPCRFHGFTIHKRLQKGAVTGIWYLLSPESIVHSWVEVLYDEQWYNLEGFIIDRGYLEQIQARNPGVREYCGYGIATTDLMRPQISWDRNDTYIQKEGINADLGVYDNPDSFFAEHAQRLGWLKRLLFRYVVRHRMNRNVQKIRGT